MAHQNRIISSRHFWQPERNAPCTRILSAADKASVDELRVIATSNAMELNHAAELNLATCESCRWSVSDDSPNSMVLGIVGHSNLLLSTIRGCYFADARRSVDYMSWFGEESLPKVLGKGAGVILGRAATRFEYGEKNLHSYLRYLFLNLCKRQGIRYVVGEIVANAQRAGQLRTIGYELHPGVASERGPLGRKQDVLFVVLDLETRYEQAISILRPRILEVESQYPWSGLQPEFPIQCGA